MTEKEKNKLSSQYINEMYKTYNEEHVIHTLSKKFLRDIYIEGLNKGLQKKIKMEDYKQIITELNNSLYEVFGDEMWEYFFYTSNGYIDIIGYGEMTLWNSEDEDREWLEEYSKYSCMKVHLISELEKRQDKLSKLTAQIKF